MKKLIAVLALVACVCGCSLVKQGVATAKEGLCWVDNQLNPCETPAPKTEANDPLPGGK